MMDSLKAGTIGNAIGGSFGSAGWTVTARTDRLWWAVPRLGEGFVELTVSNMSLPGNLVVDDNEIFGMYEAGYAMGEPMRYAPDYRENHFKVMLRIYGAADLGRPGQQKLMWGMCPSGAPGYGACTCAAFFEEPFRDSGPWDGTPQRLRIEWGNGKTRYLRNKNEVLAIDWSQSGLTFGPSELHVSLGTPRAEAVEGAGMPIGAVFSDIRIEGVKTAAVKCP
jgi:hypothetical protein